MDKLLRPGILSLQSTDPTLDQPEAFSVGELPNILLVFAFCAVFCALGLLLFILEAAADKFSLSDFSQNTPVPAADQKLLPTMERICISCHLIKGVSHLLP